MGRRCSYYPYMTTDRELVLDAARRALTRMLPNAWAIYVHGSFAREDERPDSDLDLAVLLPPGVKIADRLALAAEVSTAAGREADIVDLREANLDLVHALLRDGRTLSVRCEPETLLWEAEQMTDYGLFNSRRREILDQYLRAPLRDAS